jgi:hypothetical protein
VSPLVLSHFNGVLLIIERNKLASIVCAVKHPFHLQAIQPYITQGGQEISDDMMAPVEYLALAILH